MSFHCLVLSGASASDAMEWCGMVATGIGLVQVQWLRCCSEVVIETMWRVEDGACSKNLGLWLRQGLQWSFNEFLYIFFAVLLFLNY